MLYVLDDSPGMAADDGTAWRWVGSPPAPSQTGSIVANLVSAPAPLIKTDTSCILVTVAAAEKLQSLGIGALSLEPAVVIESSPPKPSRRHEYRQLRASKVLSLSTVSVRRDASGRVSLVEPYVLCTVPGSDEFNVAVVAENPSLLLVSRVVRECLDSIAPGLRFDAVRFEHEPAPPPALPPEPTPAPTREQLLAALRKPKPS